jgi:hypothetical protein
MIPNDQKQDELEELDLLESLKDGMSIEECTILEYNRLGAQIKRLEEKRKTIRNDIVHGIEDGDEYASKTLGGYMSLTTEYRTKFDIEAAIKAGLLTQEQALPFMVVTPVPTLRWKKYQTKEKQL